MSEAPAAPAPSAPSSASAPSSSPTTSAASPTQTSAPTSAPPTAGQSKDGATPATPVEIARHKFKLKIDGQEQEREFTNDELTLHLQKGFGSEKRFEQASKIQKQFQDYMALVEKDPAAALKVLKPDYDFRKAAEAYLRPLYEKEMMPEQERAQFEERQELERFRAEKKQRDELDAKTKQEEADAKAWSVMEKEWVKALEDSGIGPNKNYVQHMLQIALEFNQNGIDLSPTQIIAELKDRMSAQTRTLYGGLKGEALVRALGDDVVKEIQNYHVNAIKASKPAQEPISSPKAEKFDTDPEKPRFTKSFTSMKEFSKYLHKKD